MASSYTKQNTKTIVSNQAINYGAYTVSGRLDPASYEAMLALAELGGYESISAFVTEAVLTKCASVSGGLRSLFNSRMETAAFDATKDF